MLEKRQEITSEAARGRTVPSSVQDFVAAMVEANECMVLFDIEGTIRQASPEIPKLFGSIADCLIGRNLGKALVSSPISFRTLLRTLQRLRSTGNKVVCWRTTLLGPEGDTRYLELRISRLICNQELFFLALVQDISDYPRLQQRLRHSETVNRELYEKAPVMVHSIDDRGRILSVSERWLEVLGYDREEVIGRPSTDFLTAASQQYAKQVLARFRQHGKVDNAPYQFVRKDGQILDVLLSAITEKDTQGKFFRSMAVLTDVTALNRSESDRRRLETEVFRLQKFESLEVMAAGAAHDFNNVLTVVHGNVSLAMADISDHAAVEERLQDIERAAVRAGEICQQMQAFSGQEPQQNESICLPRMVSDMVSMLEVSVGKKAALKLDLQDETARVHGDPTQIRQVLMNLILNAADAVEATAGAVEVRTGSTWCAPSEWPTADPEKSPPPGTYAFFEVKDNGCGMDAKTQSRIFDPFFSTKATGRGLGMAVVFGHVRSHRGAIEVESSPKQGTRIRVLLPIEGSEPEIDLREGDAVSSGTGILVGSANFSSRSSLST